MKKHFIKRIIPFVISRYAPRGARYTFSTCAEDLIMADILGELGVDKPSYIDIGAHHPVFGNNTYLFYRRGGRGVLIEPNPVLCDEIKKKRPHDICLNAGAGKTDGEETFFAFERSTRSTFSKEQAAEWERASGQRPTIQTHKTYSLDTIISNNFKDIGVDVISIDAEGFDLEILLGFSFGKKPKLFCIESVIYGKNNPDPKDQEIFNLMKKNGYYLGLQTINNSIFVDETLIRKK